MFRLLVFWFLFSCGNGELHQNNRTSLQASLYKKYQSLLIKTDSWRHGWPSTTDCDATLWAGVASAAGVDTDISLAEYRPGVIHRRPYESCWPDNGSASTISNDMLIGYMWSIWRDRDIEAAKRLADYGHENSWIMGEPSWLVSRVVLKPNNIGTLCRMLYELSNGEIDYLCRKIPSQYFVVSEDYERHIQILSIALQGEINDGIDSNMLSRVKSVSGEYRDNYFFQTVRGIYTGEYKRAVNLLLDKNAPIPSYVRGDKENYALAHWLFSADLILQQQRGKK